MELLFSLYPLQNKNVNIKHRTLFKWKFIKQLSKLMLQNLFGKFKLEETKMAKCLQTQQNAKALNEKLALLLAISEIVRTTVTYTASYEE